MTPGFDIPPRRAQGESIVPMINVVFLLLIFFLMTSQLTPPEPIPASPPVSRDGSAVEAAPVLYMGADGTLAFQDARAEAAVAAFAEAARGNEGEAQLRADAGADAAAVARLMRDLSAQGLPAIALVVAPE